ncbi:MAG: beta-1,6-N-acetylglucosaminyltransferase [Tepidisphaeraceae bacterium]
MRDVVATTATSPTDPWRAPAPAESAAVAAPTALAKVAYFIASHVNPDQVARLIRACRSSGNPHARVVVHHDYKVSNLDAAAVERFGNVHVLKDHAPVDWGGFTQCVMIRRSMQWLLDNHDVDWVVYLSGQDYPIKPLAQVERDLALSEYDGFLDCKPVDECQWHTGIGRYHYRYYQPPKLPGWHRVRQSLRANWQAAASAGTGLPRFVSPGERHGEFKVGVLRSPFNDRFRCFYGSSWWTLNRRAIESMCRTMDARPDLVRHYRRILWAPNESFFMTLLGNDPSLNICTSNNKRLISWSDRPSGHPDVLKAEDLDRIITSDAHFARKIDQRIDPTLLDLLDRHIGANA